MGLNIAKLKKRMDRLDKETGGSKVTWFTPKVGRNVIRVLPAKDGGNDFYQEVLRHSNLDQIGMEKSFMNCRHTDPDVDSCPLCELSDQMNDSDDKKDSDIGYSIKAKTRFFMNVCLNSNDEEGNENYDTVMVYDCPPTVFREIINAITDEDYLDQDGESLILDPDEGYDFVIKRAGKGRRNTKYTVTVRPKTSEVHIADWEEKLNDLKQFTEISSEKEMVNLINGEDEEDDEDEDSDDEEEEERTTRKSSSKKHIRHRRPEPDPDEEDEDEDDDQDEDEEETKPKRRVRRTRSSSRKPSDEDEDEETEDEEERPSPRSKRRTRKNRTSKRNVEDEEELDPEDESDELEKEITEQAKSLGRKSQRKTHSKKRQEEEEEDEDDFDDDSLPF